MTTLLRLYLPADWPERQTSCEWALFGDSRTPLQQGCSEPRHWPAADHCEGVLTVEQCLLLILPLPRAARARSTAALGYALEDHLLGESEGEHCVIGNSLPQPGTPANALLPTAVWVIRRQRLDTLRATLNHLGRPLQRLISELALLPLPASSGWSLYLKPQPQASFVRQGAETGFCCHPDPDTPSVPPLELRLALQTTPQPPAVLDLYLAPGATLTETQCADWQAALGIPVRLAGEYSWRTAAHETTYRTARSLLTGDFAPPRDARHGWGSLRPALLLAMLTLTLYTLFSLGEWFWLAQRQDQLRQQMVSRFRSSFPQVQAVVDPSLQMQRMYDQLRRERGQLGQADFLPLLAAASEVTAGQSQLRRLAFEEGRLEMTLLLPDKQAAERLRNTLTQRGLATVLRDSHPQGGGRIEATFAVRSDS
ncbi:MAG: hypothetical protein KBF29_07780 [Sterolibacterium sp.]|nr:hypothetical protein [Sterolibacterium sp.]